MFFTAVSPVHELYPFVHLFWASQGISGESRKELLMPDGSTELVIGLSEEHLRTFDRKNPSYFSVHGGAVLCGPHSEPFVIDRGKEDSVIGVHFRPGGAFPFFGMPADELLNQEVPLEELWGRAAVNLREKLIRAQSPKSQFEILQAELLERLRDFRRHPAVEFALVRLSRSPKSERLSGLANEIGISSRRLIQVFRREVGLTPKTFSRLRRFQGALQKVGQRQEVDWLDVAYTCGYFDQAHLIHEFQDFATLRPSEYLARRTEFHNHVLLVQ